MEKIKNVKVKIEKVGRVWIHATDSEYNNKTVKIEINEFFTKEFAKPNIGKEVELTCKVVIEQGYAGYTVTMYPLQKTSNDIELKSTEAYQFILDNLHWTKKSVEEGKYYITPKCQEKMKDLIGEQKEEIEAILKDYKEKATNVERKIIAKKIKASIKKWTAEKAEEGRFYISSYITENIEKVEEEDREEIKEMLDKYRKIAEENEPFIEFFYPDYYLTKEECQQYIGDVVEDKRTGKYGIIRNAYCYRIKEEDRDLHPWEAQYAIEVKCEIISENDNRIIAYKKELEEKVLQEAEEAKKAAEQKKIRDTFIEEFKEEFGKHNEIELSKEEKEIKDSGQFLIIEPITDDIWLNGEDTALYGGGKFLRITNDFIWVIKNNGGDGDLWALNFIYTGGAGAYGYKTEKTEKRMQLIERLKELKIKITL